MKDKRHRKKLSRTLSILFAYTTLGFFYGNLGPALPDIQLLIGQSLDVMSWLFTATYTGSLVGTLICGPVCDRVGPQLVLFVSTFMASCLTGVLIYSPNFTVMLIVRVFTGIFIGGVDIGGIASIAELWKTEARPYMHALQFMISLGGIVTPFIIQPFLAVSYPSVTNVTQLQVTDDSYTTNPLWLENSTYVKLSMKEAFKIDEIDPIATDSEDFTNVSDFDNHTRELNISSEMRAFGETKIQYAFIIFAIVGVAASVAVFVFVATDYRNKQNKHKDNHKDHHTDFNRKKISVTDNMKYILIAIIAIQSYLSAALGLKVYAFLPSFFVIQFSWTSSTASLATSGFWIGKAIARLAGVFLSTKIKQSILVPCFTLIYIASSISLMVAANSHINVLAWIVTVTMGIGLSILRSSLFNITEEKITHVSGKIASLYLVFFVLGGMIDPLYTGYLMDDVSPMWFVYLLILESSLFLFLFIIVTVLLWKFGKRQEAGIEIEIEPMKKEEPAGI